MIGKTSCSYRGVCVLLQCDGENPDLQHIEECLLLSRLQGFLKVILLLEKKKSFLDRSKANLNSIGIDDKPLYVWLCLWEEEQMLHLLPTVGKCVYICFC